MLCSDIHQLGAGLMQPLVDDGVGTFTVQRQFPLRAANWTQAGQKQTVTAADEKRKRNHRKWRRLKPFTDDGHPLADVVEVQDGEQLVAALLSHLHDGDAVWCARAEDEAEVASCRDQRSLIRRLGLVEDLTCMKEG